MNLVRAHSRDPRTPVNALVGRGDLRVWQGSKFESVDIRQICLILNVVSNFSFDCCCNTSTTIP